MTPALPETSAVASTGPDAHPHVPETLLLAGTMRGARGRRLPAPSPSCTSGSRRTVYVGLPKNPDSFSVNESVRKLIVNLSWEAMAPFRIELKVQSPSGRTWTAAEAPTSGSNDLSLAIDDVDAPGEWYVGVQPIGPAVDVAWRAEVQLFHAP